MAFATAHAVAVVLGQDDRAGIPIRQIMRLERTAQRELLCKRDQVRTGKWVGCQHYADCTS